VAGGCRRQSDLAPRNGDNGAGCAVGHTEAPVVAQAHHPVAKGELTSSNDEVIVTQETGGGHVRPGSFVEVVDVGAPKGVHHGVLAGTERCPPGVY